MTKRKQHVSGDNSVFDQISVDLIVNIMSKLPVKSIAQCRCVSKLWSSIIRRPNYNMLFPAKSQAAPRFLFIVANGLYGPNFFISSSPQPQYPDKHSSLEATLHISSIATDYCQICPPVNGLVCRYMYGKDFIYVVVSNPITGENVTTPKVTTKGYPSKEKIYFGYDPVEEQFKVLFMTWLPSSGSHEYQVLTLGTRNLSWRRIQCSTLHYPHEDDGICINENAEEHKWSDTFYKMPEVLRPSRIESVFSAGMIGTGEVVLYRKYAQIFYILYYNLEKNIITSVSLRVPGLDYVEYNEVHTFPNFVGELKLM
ncbi:unnamed protein product [Arabidopsis thaliana]|uniref:F-box domain-containing protein n=1 Tax=Arabidopsis thaliana TaxID=3702 RepID=A0A5S9WJ93_ARATH|nr:unnamed protein product [Arabidopsis thaliana]